MNSMNIMSYKKREKQSRFTLFPLSDTKKLRSLPTIPEVEKFTVFTINFLPISGNVRRKDFFATTIRLDWRFFFVHNVLQLIQLTNKTVDLLRNLLGPATSNSWVLLIYTKKIFLS